MSSPAALEGLRILGDVMNTLQDVFTRVKNHLLSQEAQSVNSDGLCMYRGPDGRKCAVGALIADEYYHPSLEGRCADEDTVQAALKYSGVDVSTQDMQDLVYHLQGVHDNTVPSAWEGALREVASEYKLTYDEVAG